MEVVARGRRLLDVLDYRGIKSSRCSVKSRRVSLGIFTWSPLVTISEPVAQNGARCSSDACSLTAARRRADDGSYSPYANRSLGCALTARLAAQVIFSRR